MGYIEPLEPQNLEPALRKVVNGRAPHPADANDRDIVGFHPGHLYSAALLFRLVLQMMVNGKRYEAKGVELFWPCDAERADARIERRWVHAEQRGGAFFAGDAPSGRFQGAQDVLPFQLLKLAEFQNP